MNCTVEQAIARARELKMIAPVFVYEIDDEAQDDGRRLCLTVTKDYIDSGEFQAFDGVVRAIVNPDGSVD